MSEVASGSIVARMRVSAWMVCFLSTGRTRRRSHYHRRVCRQELPDGEKQIQGHADQGWLEPTARAYLQEEYGNDYTISDCCCLTKVKIGKTKKRLILDLTISGISRTSRKTHRVVLPRLSDLVQDLLDFVGTKRAHQSVEVSVLDFTAL